jgi:hypothetical protein
MAGLGSQWFVSGLMTLGLAVGCGGSSSSSGDGAIDAAVVDGSGNDGAGDQLTQEVLANTCGVVRRMPLTSADGASMWPAVVWDGNAFVVVWSDARSGSPDIFMTFINPDGSRARGATDMMVAHTPYAAISPRVSPLGNSRYLLVWENCAGTACAGGSTVGRVVVDGNGQVVVPVGELSTLAVVQRRPHVIAAFGLVYVAFRDVVGNNVVSRVMPLDLNGTPLAAGAVFGANTAAQYPFVTAANGKLALIYSRGIGQTDIVFDLLDQNLGVSRELVVRQGTRQATNPVAQWNGNGWTLAWEDQDSGEVLVEETVTGAEAASAGQLRPIDTANSNWPMLASDGTNTVIAYYGFPADAQVLVARVDRTGQPIGTPVQVSQTGSRSRYPSIAYSGNADNGYGIVWHDEKTGEVVYAQVVCR